MWTRRLLIALPIIVCAFLLQSYFWTPTYEQQARLTPERLRHFIHASIGDAEILNPILSSDTASSDVHGMIFEGLIDRDRDLNWRGRVAESWAINKTSYLVVNPDDERSPEEIQNALRDAIERHRDEDTPLAAGLRNIIEVGEVQPAETLTETVHELPPPDEDTDEPPEPEEVTLTIHRPPRIVLEMDEVDQDLDRWLEEVLGEGYLSGFDGPKHIEVSPAAFAVNAARYAETFQPAIEHNPIITFHLRRGVLFHDGVELDSGDVKFTYEAIMNPANASPRSSSYEPVKAVETPDKYTVRVIYKRLFYPGFGSWYMGILPEHLLNEEALKAEAKRRGIPPDEFSLRQSRFNRRPVGSGPFRFSRWQSDEFVELLRFDDYWEGPPEYERWTMRIIPDLVTQEMEFYAGAIDRFGAQPHQVERLRKDPRFQSFSGLAFGYNYIGYNARREPFDDPRVRKALGMAIDIDEIIEYVFYNQAERMTGPFPKQTDYYNHDIPTLPYDPERAKELLAEAGFELNDAGWLERDGRRFQFTLITNQGNPIRLDILTLAQDSWRRLGIDVRTDVVEWSVFISRYINQSEFDACILGWSMSIDPDLFQIWHSSQTNPGQLNFVGFKNERADELIVRIRREYDDEERVRMCHELHELIAKKQPYTFISVGMWTALLDRRIVRVQRDDEGNVIGYKRIVPTITGSYTYDFDEWLKVPDAPVHEP